MRVWTMWLMNGRVMKRSCVVLIEHWICDSKFVFCRGAVPNSTEGPNRAPNSPSSLLCTQCGIIVLQAVSTQSAVRGLLVLRVARSPRSRLATNMLTRFLAEGSKSKCLVDFVEKYPNWIGICSNRFSVLDRTSFSGRRPQIRYAIEPEPVPSWISSFL